jgi:hypothetical protein
MRLVMVGVGWMKLTDVGVRVFVKLGVALVFVGEGVVVSVPVSPGTADTGSEYVDC